MAKALDLTGERFGRWAVLQRIKSNHKKIMYQCVCECGTEKLVYGSNLKNGKSLSCGCLAREMSSARLKAIKQNTIPKLEGQRFSKLLVSHYTDERSTDGEVLWLCICDCGKSTYVKTSNLLKGITNSCGCHWREQQKKSMGFVDGTSVVAITRKTGSNNTSGVKGVKWHKGQKKWTANIGFKGKRYWLGSFHTIDEATQVRKIAESKLFGEFLDWYNNEYKVGELNEIRNNDSE